MKKRVVGSLAGVGVVVLALLPLLLAANVGSGNSAGSSRLVIKVCNWDGVVPQPALDGFQMPAGKWADFQKEGWQVESYLVAPNDQGGKNGLYAVLKK